jgi:hypothetical protein
MVEWPHGQIPATQAPADAEVAVALGLTNMRAFVDPRHLKLDEA